MDIYAPTKITKSIKDRFKPTRLAIKELAGQYYFCKTTRKNIESYSGSGIEWTKIIKKYGKNNIKTLWISDWYDDPHEIQKIALHFSMENDIVQSEKWANLKPENGLDGGSTVDIQNNPITKKKKSDSAKRVQGEVQNRDEVKQKNSEGVKRAFNDPIMKARHQAACLKAQNRPEQKSLRSNKTGRSSSTYNHKIFVFHHVDGRIENLTIGDMIVKFNLSASGLSNMMNGRSKSTKGWTLKLI